MPSCTHDDSGPNLTVYGPLFSGAFNAFEVGSTIKASARSFQQIVVKLTPANPVTDRLPVGDFNFAGAHDASAKSNDRLKGPPQSILRDVYIEFAEDGRRDPSAADLVAREMAFVEDDRVQAAARQFPRAR